MLSTWNTLFLVINIDPSNEMHLNIGAAFDFHSLECWCSASHPPR